MRYNTFFFYCSTIKKCSYSVFQTGSLEFLPDDENCILFNGVSYLGCSTVNAPRSEPEALRTISILRAQHMSSGAAGKDTVIPGKTGETSQHIEIVLSVPNTADGVVR